MQRCVSAARRRVSAPDAGSSLARHVNGCAQKQPLAVPRRHEGLSVHGIERGTWSMGMWRQAENSTAFLISDLCSESDRVH